MMNFRSDNEAGAHPLVIDALGHAFASGSPASFGEDRSAPPLALPSTRKAPHLPGYPVRAEDRKHWGGMQIR